MSMKRSEIRSTAKTRLWLKQLIFALNYTRKISKSCLLFATEFLSIQTLNNKQGATPNQSFAPFSYSFIFFDILLAKYTNGVSARLVTINIT